MNGLSKIYDRVILGNPIIVLIVLLSLLLFFSYHAKDFKLDASAESLLLEGDKDLKIFREVNERFNIKDFLFVTFTPHEDLFSRESLNLLKSLRDKLKPLDRVDSVVSILDIPLLQSSGIKLSEMKQENIKYLENHDVDIKSAKKELLESPICKDLLISADGQTTALQIILKTNMVYSELQKKREKLLDKKRSGKLSPIEQSQLKKYSAEYEEYNTTLSKDRHQDIKKIRSLLGPFKEHAVVHLGGMPMIAEDMIMFINDDLVIFGFGVFIFVVVTLTVIFRKIRWVVLPLLSCFFAVMLMIGILGFLNWKVTVISSNFISLMLILTMSMNIHLTIRYRQLCGDFSSTDQKGIVSATIRKMVWPCLYTSLTTIIAFSSLVFSGIKPVIDFGWMMTIGLFVTFATSFLLFPAILVLLKKSGSIVNEERQFAITSTLASITESHGRKVILLSVLFAVISIIGISKLRVENSFINYFSKNTEIYQGMQLIDEKLGGTNPLEIILNFGSLREDSTADDDSAEMGDDDPFEEGDFGWSEENNSKDYWFTPYKIERIKKIHDYLDSLPEIGSTLSLASGIRTIEQLNDGKAFDGLELGVLYKRIPDRIKSDWIDSYVSVDHNEVRFSLLILDSLKDLRRKELLERIRKDLNSKFGFSKDKVTITGMLVLYNNMLQSLFRSQILTLGIVLLGIAIMLLIFFRSISLSIIGIIPNLLAVGIVLGIMGLMDIPLDMMTITIAAIAMGIAIDNSIHYIYRFKEEFAKNGNYAETLRICHGNVGKAILNTSVTIIFGFSILVFSNFIPTIYFGLFTGLAMFIALMAILTLLPRIILLWRPFKSHTTEPQ